MFNDDAALARAATTDVALYAFTPMGGWLSMRTVLCLTHRVSLSHGGEKDGKDLLLLVHIRCNSHIPPPLSLFLFFTFSHRHSKKKKKKLASVGVGFVKMLHFGGKLNKQQQQPLDDDACCCFLSSSLDSLGSADKLHNLFLVFS